MGRIVRMERVNNNNNNLTFIIRRKHAMQTQRRRSLHIGKTHDQHLEARQGTILNNHRVIGVATNTSKVLNCVTATYLLMTADVGLPDTL